MNQQKKVIVKVMTVKNNVHQVFNFFSNPKNMELGGALELIEDNDDGGGSSTTIQQEDQK